MTTNAKEVAMEEKCPSFLDATSPPCPADEITPSELEEKSLLTESSKVRMSDEDHVINMVENDCDETQADNSVLEQPPPTGSTNAIETNFEMDFDGGDEIEDESAELSERIRNMTSEVADEGETLPVQANATFDVESTSLLRTETTAPGSEETTLQAEPSAFSECRLLGLPIDALHAIISFLTPEDGCRFGLCSSAASEIFRGVLRTVRMHGFRCATEVVAAWKLNQHSDAKELCALYISAGVPIYPWSWGHSYHTLVWRMAIEAQEVQPPNSRLRDPMNVEGGPAEEVAENPRIVDPVERFFADRYQPRARDGLNHSMSYLEEKSHYMLKAAKKTGGGPAGGRTLPRGGQPGLPQHHLPHHHGLGHLHDGHLNDAVPHPSHPSRWSFPSGQPRGPGLSTSESHSDVTNRDPKVVVRVHRHLLDQHLLGRPCVDDKDGTMMPPPINFAADFFHPVNKVNHFPSLNGKVPQPNSRFSSADSLALGEQGLTTSRRIDAPGETGGLVPEMPFNEMADSDSVDGPMVGQHVVNASEMIFEPPNAVEYGELAAARRAQEPSSRSLLNPVLDNVELDVYSAMTADKEALSKTHEEIDVHDQLRSRFAYYKRRLDGLEPLCDNHGFDECLLDFWDEFLPQTAHIHYFDRCTAVPRISYLNEFLTKPCPRAVGVMQCEIERIKADPKKKGVNMKGRFFPTYEYRLFIRHRPPDTVEGPEPLRFDTVLMTAKNKGRKHMDGGGLNSPNKKGANNYFLYLPERGDVEQHWSSVNKIDVPSKSTLYNGADSCAMTNSSSPTLMGRLQSNFIGTEFQIFRPRVTKKPDRKVSYTGANRSEDDVGCDGGGGSSDYASSCRRMGRFARLSLRCSGGSHSSGLCAITEADGVASPIRRSRSSGDVNDGSRRTRISRRAIANNSEEAVVHRVHPAPSELEDGAITYTANLLGSRPRIMDVCIPKVSPEGVSGAEWTKYVDKCSPDSESVSASRMLNHLKQMQQRMENEDRSERQNATLSDATGDVDDYSPPEDFGLLALQNRPPWWNDELHSFVLNFGGRVSVASVKNFQLCDRGDQDYIMLQFGRIQGRHSFTMDFQHPLTAVQAFAIAISSLQSKISLG